MMRDKNTIYIGQSTEPYCRVEPVADPRFLNGPCGVKIVPLTKDPVIWLGVGGTRQLQAIVKRLTGMDAV